MAIRNIVWELIWIKKLEDVGSVCTIFSKHGKLKYIDETKKIEERVSDKSE